MISFLVACLLTFVKNQTVEGLLNPTPIVFGETGQDVTIHSRVEEIPVFFILVSWYLQRPGGKVEPVVHFTADSLEIGRYVGGFSKGSGNLTLTVSKAEISDSGRYFPMMYAGQEFTPGSPSDLAITDPQRIPVMRVFLSSAGTVLCELSGVGPSWDDPEWETADDGRKQTLLEAEEDRYIDENRVFTRSSILFVGEKDGIPGIKCVSRHNTGAVIRSPVIQHGNRACQLLLYLSPVCVVLLLLTVTAGGLWTRRVIKQTHIVQENLNG